MLAPKHRKKEHHRLSSAKPKSHPKLEIRIFRNLCRPHRDDKDQELQSIWWEFSDSVHEEQNDCHDITLTVPVIADQELAEIEEEGSNQEFYGTGIDSGIFYHIQYTIYIYIINSKCCWVKYPAHLKVSASLMKNEGFGSEQYWNLDSPHN